MRCHGGGARGSATLEERRRQLIDLQGGFQLGPLLLEARGIYSTGNKARDNIARNVRYFQPLDTDKTEDGYRRNRRIELKLTER